MTAEEELHLKVCCPCPRVRAPFRDTCDEKGMVTARSIPTPRLPSARRAAADRPEGRGEEALG